MTDTNQNRRLTAVRVLALVAALAAALAALEARALEKTRDELQTLQSERTRAAESVESEWTRLPAVEFEQATRDLDDFLQTGIGRPGGLCAGGRIDDEDIARLVLGTFEPLRASGASMVRAKEAMHAAAKNVIVR